MIRVVKTQFRASKQDLDRLFECNRISGRIWNDCLKIARKHHKKTGKWVCKTELQQELKQKYPLHSQSIQGVAHKYLQARTGAHQARIKGYNTRYPYKEKKNFPTKWAKDGYQIKENGKIELSRGNWQGKRQKPLVVHVSKVPSGSIKEIELVWDNGLFLAISYDDNTKAKEPTGKRLAAIDMGEIHAVSAVAENGEAVIITGRKLRSIKRLRNKKHKELAKQMSRLKKGSRRWKKLQRSKRKITSKTEAQQKNILHNVTHKFVEWAVSNEVKTVIVGDVDGVQRNTSSKKKSNPKKKRRPRKTSQKLSQWPFGLVLAYLAYKLAAVGIELIKFPEEYTSQTCPVCKRRKKISGRVYKCYCGYSEHRDIHGARNILAKYKYGEICDTGIEIANVKYLRPTV